MFGYKDSSINIYIVDDDVLLLKILENKFKKSTGYNIYTFTSGEDFLHFYISNPVKKSHIQIVLLDYNLSTMDSHTKDGIEILKYIKEISRKVEVIVLSGYATELISDKMMRLGAAACIKKNENSHIRIQNTIKWIISEQLIKDKKKQSKITFVIFAVILFAIVLTAIFNVFDIAI
jgi:DNA-binding NarL/FixJ family response regulator